MTELEKLIADNARLRAGLRAEAQATAAAFDLPMPTVEPLPAAEQAPAEREEARRDIWKPSTPTVAWA